MLSQRSGAVVLVQQPVDLNQIDGINDPAAPAYAAGIDDVGALLSGHGGTEMLADDLLDMLDSDGGANPLFD